MTARHRAHGFTLLEMALVISIIGVVIGGIIVAKTLVVNARLQTVLTDIDNYTKATLGFQQAYQGLPGDLSNAATLWGTDANGCPSGGGAGTCSGNGDGKIGGVSGYEYESFRFWQQLNLAHLVNASFTGIAASGGPYAATIGSNTPKGPLKGSGYGVIWWGNLTSDYDRYDGSYGNIIQIGTILQFGNNTTDTVLIRGPVFSPEQAASLDAKIDDGLPGSGKVRAYLPTSSLNPGCAVAGNAYNLGPVTPLCSLAFISGF